MDGGATLAGGLTISASGDGRTEGLFSLPDGQYKLTWNFEGENGAGKQKVFKVDCAPASPTPTPTLTPTPTPTSTPPGAAPAARVVGRAGRTADPTRAAAVSPTFRTSRRSSARRPRAS